MDPRNNENFYLLINALVSLSFVLGIGFLSSCSLLYLVSIKSYLLMRVLVQWTFVHVLQKDSLRENQNIIIALTAVEFQNEATLCK